MKNYFIYYVSYFDTEKQERVRFNLNIYDYYSKDKSLKFARRVSTLGYCNVRITIVKCNVIEVVNI